MSWLRIWCLIALFAIATCQPEIEASGGDNGAISTDDEDESDYTDDLGSGSGAGMGLPSTNITVFSTSTQRPSTSVKVVTSTTVKTVRTTQPAAIKTTKAPRVPTTESQDEPAYDPEETIDDSIDEVATSPSVPDLDDELTVTTTEPPLTTTRDLFDLMWKQPGIVAGLIGGAVLGVLFAILLTLFIIYRLRRRADRGAYRRGGSRGSQDDTGAFWFDDEEGGAIAVSRASAERYPQAQAAYLNPQAGGTLKSSQMLTMPPGMNVQTQQHMYASLAPNAQTAYDEYLANLYNQQLYNGYIQQKA